MFPEASASAEAPQSSADLLDSIDLSSDTPDQQDAAETEGQQQAADPPAEAAGEQEDPYSLDKIFEDEEGDPEQVQEDGRNAYKMSPERMNRFVAAKKIADGISEFAPSVEAAREHYQRANDFSTMESDFRNPMEPVKLTGPDGQEREVPAARAWLEHWAGVSPEGVGAVAEMLPQFLAESGNTAALAKVESTVLGATVSGMYRKAAQSGDPDDLTRAQNLDFALNGKFRENVDQFRQREPQQNNLQQREQQLQQRENNIVQRQWTQFDQQHVSGAKQQALDVALNQIFDKAEVKGAFSAPLLNALRSQVATSIQQKLASDTEWSRNHQIRQRDIQTAYTQAVRSNKQTNLTPHAKALVDDYSARIRRELIAVAKPLFQDATRNTVNANQATHKRLAAGAGKSAPSGSGGPVRRSIAPVPQGRTSMDLINEALG